MDLQLSIVGNRDLTRQLFRQLRERILDGRLQAGERLPASRELADELSIARKTITNVYDLLTSEGFLTSRRGSGTFVAESIPLRKQANTQPISRIEVSPRWTTLSHLVVTSPPTVAFDFAVGVPDVSRFPFPLWRSLLGSRARVLSNNASTYAEPQGYPALREAIANYTSFTRAVVCSAGDVVITNGAQQAFALVSYVLVGPGTVVAMEQPGYERARALFELHGARIVDVPVDEQGLIVERLPRQARIVYVTPSHQFPLGVRMSLPRRTALLEWAAKHGAAIIEDDYDSEFRFESRPLDSLQSLDRQGVVLYVGTFSKVLFPGVRIGFVIAPEPLRSALIAARQLTDWHGPLIIQATLAKFIQEGHLARHIRKMRRVYGERRQLLLRYLKTEAPDLLMPWPSSAGLHISARLNRKLPARKVAEAARRASINIESYVGNSLTLGYGAIEVTRIEEGLRQLTQVIRQASK